MVNQLPPVELPTVAVRVNCVPVLAMVMTCERGLAPAKVLLKLSGLIWRKTDGPTITVMGMETESPVVFSRTWPVKVPAVRPSPGNLARVMLTVRLDGAVPLAAERVSQAPPSAVLVAAVQASVPAPAFRI